MTEPYSAACERNKQPILALLKKLLRGDETVLEIGSGTGQHAVFFAQQLPNITWQTSDKQQNHVGILNWLNSAKLPNVLPPIALDVNDTQWQLQQTDVVFSANTAHIMSWSSVEQMFCGVGKVLKPNGLFILYGPFNYHGQYTSDSNRNFDRTLQKRDPESGIRDFEALNQLAEQNNLMLLDDIVMPANNRILVWRRKSQHENKQGQNHEQPNGKTL